MTRIKNRACALLLALALLLSLVPEALAAEVQAEATTVQMTKTEGTVGISNSSGRSISLIEKMRLYNGYHVETEEKSYAWINLDSTKLSKLDAVSEMELRKSGKKLELLLNEGNLFFNVTEPLEDDESLNIRTSTIVVGIRGTCGWVKIIDQWRVEVYVLEGTVTITVTDPVTGQTKEEPVSGGEKATCVVYPQDKNGDKCDILRDGFDREDIDGFVLVELAPDEPLVEKIYEETGIDLRDWPENPEERLKEDQEKVAEKLREIEKQLEEQDEHISTDPVWTEEPTPAPVASEEPEPEPEPDPAPGPVSDVVTLTLPVEDDVVNDYLNRGYVRQVIVQTGNGARSSTATTLEVDSGITIPAGKILTLRGNGTNTTTLTLDILAGQTMQVNGNLRGNSGKLSIICSGTIINYGTITIPPNIKSGGRCINRGSITNMQVLGGGTVDNEGGVINNLSIFALQDTGTATIHGGRISSQGGTPIYITYSFTSTSGWIEQSNFSITNCTIESENSPAIYWQNNYYANINDYEVEQLKATAYLPQMTNTIIRAKTTNIAVISYCDGTGNLINASFIPNGYEIQQSGEWYYLVATGSTPVVPTPDPGTELAVTFNAGGGSWTDPDTGALVGSKATRIPAGTTLQGAFESGIIDHPERTGYTLIGWTRPDGTVFTPTTPFTEDITLTAQWADENGDTVVAEGTGWKIVGNTLYVTVTGGMEQLGELNEATGEYETWPWNSYSRSITNVVIEDGATTIGEQAFRNFGSLTSVSIPTSVTRINKYAFSNCSSLTSITIPDSVTYINDSAFNGTGLTSVAIPQGVTYIGYFAFNSCRSLTSVTIPASVTTIGESAFEWCSSLTSISIPEGVQNILTCAFQNCTGLTSVSIPVSVTRIDQYAFNICPNLTNVYYSGTEDQWNAIYGIANIGLTASATVHYESTGPSPRTAAASPYSDVPLTASYAPAVLYCREHELMNGTDATHFTPDGTLTRAMMVTVLHRLAGTPAAGTASAFPDVASGQWYTQAVSWANSKGIVLGYPDGSFGVSDPVTHEQVALIFQRYSGGEAVEVVGAENPSAPATRAEIVATLMNYAKSGALSAVSAIDVMCAPSGIVPMKDGTVLVTDTYHKQLWKVNLGAGTVYAGGDTVTGLYGEPLGGYNDASLLESYFKEPWAVAPFLDGWAVSDTANNVVRLVRTKDTQTLNGKTSEGLTVTKLGVAFDRPTGLATDGKGNLYVSDTGKGAVRKITPEGKVTTVAKGLDQPMGLCWKNGVLYIAETGADRVVKLQNGQVTVVASGFNGPQGVAVGDDGTIYVADTSSGAVRMVRNGEVTTLVERDTAQVRSGLTAPRGLLVQDGRLYICDGFARKIFVLRLG